MARNGMQEMAYNKCIVHGLKEVKVIFRIHLNYSLVRTHAHQNTFYTPFCL